MDRTRSPGPSAARAIGPALHAQAGWLLAAAFFAILPAIGWAAPPQPPIEESDQPLREIIARGSVESTRTIEIRCEVKPSNSSGIAIIGLVPEGSLVKPGDALVKLDSSALEDELAKQQIVCAVAETVTIKTRGDYEASKTALVAYTHGTYRVESLAIQNEIFVAQKQLQRAEGNLALPQRKAEAKKASTQELDDAQFARQVARNDLKLAETRLEVLEKYTKKRMVRQLEIDIKTNQAKFETEQLSHQRELQRLGSIKRQIKTCVILAPVAGQVFYAHVAARHGGFDVVIEEGTMVRERQAILRLVDPKHLQVKARLSESNVALIKEGMTATIVIAEKKMTGTVTRVGKTRLLRFATANDVGVYETTICIDDPPTNLRVGSTAEVRIDLRKLARERQPR